MTDDKEARRAAALRANLRKRKAQQRARAEAPEPEAEPAADGREALKEARPPSSEPQPRKP
jgi:hypothetical protein